MWGGFKKPVLPPAVINEIVRKWSPSDGLPLLRHRLHFEPRPWALFWRLHRGGHLLDDRNCSTLLRWTHKMLLLEPTCKKKMDMMALANEMLNMMVTTHHPAQRTIRTFFQLCEAVGDVTTAYRWFNYFVESGRGPNPLMYAQLLKCAAACQSDNLCEEMVEAVLEHSKRFETLCSGEEVVQALNDVLPRVTANLDLAQRIRRHIEGKSMGGKPASSSFATHIDASPTYVLPVVRDSMLSPSFVEQLEQAAFKGDVGGIVEKLGTFSKQPAALPAEETEKRMSPFWQHGAEMNYFRQSIPADGLTPELHHYAIVALCKCGSAGLALKTVERMRAANLRPLDASLACICCAVHPDVRTQASLLKQHNDTALHRQKVLHDNEEHALHRAYWAYNLVRYTDYVNALSHREFMQFVADVVGLEHLQDILLLSNCCTAATKKTDLISASDDFRAVVFATLQRSTGEAQVGDALDFVSSHAPLLDVALVNEIRHFADYTPSSEIAFSVGQLQQELAQVEALYVLDASFIETCDDFASVVRRTASKKNPTLLVPFVTLRDLNDTLVASEPCDSGLHREVRAAKQQADSRLLQLSSLSHERAIRVLHFSESLLSHSSSAYPTIPRPSLKEEVPSSSGSERNVEMIFVTAMLRTLTSQKCEVVLCTDDPQLTSKATSELSAVTVLGHDHSNGLSPIVESLKSETFVAERLLEKEKPLAPVSSPNTTGSEAATAVPNSPWLSLLDHDDEDLGGGPTTQQTSPHEKIEDSLPPTTQPMDTRQAPGVFEEFHSRHLEATQLEDKSTLAGQRGKQERPLQHRLQRNFLSHRFVSKKAQYRAARYLSNGIGGKVPTNLRFHLFEANVNDPRNRSLIEEFRNTQERIQNMRAQ